MKQVLATVRENREVAESTYRMRLRAPEVAAHARPGQFVHVRPAPVGEMGTFSFDPLLRRPLSLLRADPKAGEIEVLYDVVGRGTALLARARVADELDVLGPLGKPFELAPKTRHALLVGGGIGVVPLVMLAEAAIARDVSVTLLAGYRTAAKAFPTDLIPPEAEYVVATDDGTLGRPASSRPSCRSTSAGPTRSSPAGRSRCSRRSAGSRSRAACRCRSRWRSTWAARWASASAAWSRRGTG